MAFKKINLTSARLKIYLADADTVNFYRRNPVIACEDLLGIYLSDAQAWILAETWTKERAAWSCCRNFGKSFLIAIYCILRAILYPNQNIYIVSSVGNQAKETFSKMEEIVLRVGTASESTPDLKDIASGEVETSNNNLTGFNHSSGGYNVKFHNGSSITTLNSTPDNNRGKRSNLTVFDEAAFCSSILIEAIEPFSSQKSSAKYGKDAAEQKDILTKKPPNQIIYASSQNDMDAKFYKYFKDYSKRMIIGDNTVFACDMTADTAMNMYMKGKSVPSLLSPDIVDNAIRTNPEQGRREYYNKPDASGGVNQIISWGTMRRNEMQIIPYIECRGNKIVLAFDPARTIDNSVLTAMELVEDEELGLCGNVISCVNFIDVANSKKYKLDSNRQLAEIRDIILKYNGDNPDYEYLDRLMIDSGAGGGGMSTYADQLLNDYIAKNGKAHRGLIDAEADAYREFKGRYPDAINKLCLISPKKYRTQMVEELIELMQIGVIRFPYSYNGGDHIKIIKKIDVNSNSSSVKNKYDDEKMETYRLSEEEKINLRQIDLLKTEVCSIHKSVNAEGTSVTYALPKEKQNIMHDDRFYTLLLLAHRLFILRRAKQVGRKKEKKNLNNYIYTRAPKLL